MTSLILSSPDGSVHPIQIDEADEPAFRSRGDWQVVVTNRSPRVYRYVAAFEQVEGSWRTVYLHRLIVGAAPKIPVRFRDGDGLNLRRANLVYRQPAREE